MKHEELIVRITLKPNCGLENTRASLVVRRISPLCDSISCHPSTVKSDSNTIDYLRDHGFFIRFHSSIPEQVILAVKASFFVDSCTLVESADTIPPFTAATGAESASTEHAAFAPPATFARQDETETRHNELTKLLAQFEEIQRSLRAYTERVSHNHELSNIVFTHAQTVDALRTTVARSRVEPFNRIASSLHTLVNDYSRRFGTPVDLDIIDGHMALDRSILTSMEEILKSSIRSCIRDGIERPNARTAAGKPARASMRLRLESDGSEIVCRIEHDGRLFDASIIRKQAAACGLLTRPPEDYTADEIGAFLLLPGFSSKISNQTASAFSQFNEIGSMLQRAGARGDIRNTTRGTLEISLRFPVPFTIMEAALVRVGNALFALPAQQIERFEAFHSDHAQRADDAPTYCERYVDEDGKSYELLNRQASPSLFDTENPSLVILLQVLDEKCALAVDAVDGYERISVNRLPTLLDRRKTREAGCIGYAILEDGFPCIVVSIRRLLGFRTERRGIRA